MEPPFTAHCTIDGCKAKHEAKGFCAKHYQKFRKYGDPLAGKRKASSVDEAFAWYTKWDNGCLVWTGSARNECGYGSVSFNNRTYLAHRVAWEREVGPIPDGMVLDHTCHNPPCVFVKHLRLATIKQNNENLKPLRKNNTSGYRGVSWDKNSRKWVVQVSVNGRSRQFGYFHDKREAAEHAERVRSEIYTHA